MSRMTWHIEVASIAPLIAPFHIVLQSRMTIEDNIGATFSTECSVKVLYLYATSNYSPPMSPSLMFGLSACFRHPCSNVVSDSSRVRPGGTRPRPWVTMTPCCPSPANPGDCLPCTSQPILRPWNTVRLSNFIMPHLSSSTGAFVTHRIRH